MLHLGETLDHVGFASNTYGGQDWNNVINCCSLGKLDIINGDASNTVCPLGNGQANQNHKNNYFLSGIQGQYGVSLMIGDYVFYKTSANASDMTTVKVVEALNSYIESNADEVDTTGWCKWKVGSNNLPTLDYSTEWNGTSWVTTN